MINAFSDGSCGLASDVINLIEEDPVAWRRSTSAATLLAGALLALAGVAAAQPLGRGGSATLYEGPNFEGRSVTITAPAANLDEWRFNDRAQSARFQGQWRICEHDAFRGRCQTVSGAVADLTTYGLMGQISSLAPAVGEAGGGWDDGPRGRPPRGGRDTRGIEGARTVFFPRPTVDGLDLAAGDNGANRFCRSQGLGPALWFDSSERAPQALGPEGQIVGRSSVLRDLLCRKY